MTTNEIIALVAFFVVLVVLILLVRELRLARLQRTGAVRLPVLDPALDDVEITKMAPTPRNSLPKLEVDATDDLDDSWSDRSQALTLFVGDAGERIDEPTGSKDLILLWGAAQSDVGKRRRRNEDQYLVLPEHDLYVVADGMGGYAAGDVASKLAVDTINAAFKENASPTHADPARPALGNQLVSAIETANETIWRTMESNATYTGMGTTVVAARFAKRKQRAYIAHVGDSRCYRFREDALKLLTKDHTLAGKGVTGPLASNLRRALGVAPKVKVDLVIDVPHPSDIYLMCSDGLTNLVSSDGIADIIRQPGTIQERVEKLIAAANAAGGRDNVTVILVAVQPEVPGVRPESPVANGSV